MNPVWRKTAVGVGFALTAACMSGTKTDQPVVTTTDQGRTTSSPAGTETATRGKSLVRLVNALPAKRSIDVSSNDRTVFSSVAYRTVTPYTEIGDNRVTFRLRAAGTDSAQADNHETLADGDRYTIVALPDEHGGVQLRIVGDKVVPDSGKARIRVINTVPGSNGVDIAVQGTKDPLFRGADYAAGADYKDIDPTTATIEIRRNGPNLRPILLKNMRF
ncbi:MAG: DUF4397 domain-containing protein, partial [Gemmatimonadota bacterium]